MWAGFGAWAEAVWSGVLLVIDQDAFARDE
jgi:hypothetical protein